MCVCVRVGMCCLNGFHMLIILGPNSGIVRISYSDFKIINYVNESYQTELNLDMCEGKDSLANVPLLYSL